MSDPHPNQAVTVPAAWRAFAVAGTMSILVIGCGGNDSAPKDATASPDTPTTIETAPTNPPPNSSAAPTFPPTTTEPSVESTAPSTSSVTTTEPESDSIPGWSGQTFGRVRALFFEPGLTFDAPDDSTLLCPPTPQQTGIALGLPGGPVPPGSVQAGLLVMQLSETTVEATVESIVAGLSTSTEPQPDTIDGAAGLTFDGSAPDGDAETLYIGLQSDCTLKFDAGELWRFWVVDVDGTPVTFAVWGTSPDFDGTAAELEAVIRTIEWTHADDT